MTDQTDNYIPIALQQRFRAQATSVWVITTSVVLLWVAAIVVAPLLAPSGLATPIYTFFSYICHQIPDRSLHIAGHQLGVCSRCFGVYFGVLAGVIVYPLWRRLDETEPLSRVWLFASLIPITVDWSLTVFGVWENTHLSRFVTGLILGFACATFIVPAVVDITRNLSRAEKRTAS